MPVFRYGQLGGGVGSGGQVEDELVELERERLRRRAELVLDGLHCREDAARPRGVFFGVTTGLTLVVVLHLRLALGRSTLDVGLTLLA